MEFRLNEAFERAKQNGDKVTKIELAKKLWPGRSNSTLQVNMTNLCNGKTKTIKPEWVKVICSELKVDANFLFNSHNEFSFKTE